MANDKGTEAPVSPKDVFKRQSEAGTVIGSARQPELSPKERDLIQELNIPSNVLSEADRELLKRQSTAGIGANPPFTPEEVNRIAEINSKSGTRRR